MENGSLIGALAIFTVGAALLGGFGALAYFLRDPRNREHAHRTLVRDETAASTEHEQRDGLAPIKQRLDHSEASSHANDPADPSKNRQAR